METITIAASRGSALSLSEAEMLMGSALVIGLLAWMLLSRLRRDRQQPHA